MYGEPFFAASAKMTISFTSAAPSTVPASALLSCVRPRTSASTFQCGWSFMPRCPLAAMTSQSSFSQPLIVPRGTLHVSSPPGSFTSRSLSLILPASISFPTATTSLQSYVLPAP